MTQQCSAAESLLVDESSQGKRLDIWLRDELAYTRSQLAQWIKSGSVTVNGSTVKAGYSIKAGDIVTVVIPVPEPWDLQPQDLALDIVYEDEQLIVVNKQAGMVVHPAPGHREGTLVNALLFHCRDLSGIGGVIRPGIVHRLDKDTTGLLAAAKNDAAHQHLSDQLRRRRMSRHYTALAQGRFKEEEGVVDAPLGRHPQDRKKMAVIHQGRPARTHFRVLADFGRWTLLECRLDTGRTHQIRVHLAAVHHPIVGDPLYGWQRNDLGAQRQLLHAHYLGFDHPDGRWMEFRAALPEDFLDVLRRIKKST